MCLEVNGNYYYINETAGYNDGDETKEFCTEDAEADAISAADMETGNCH